MKAIYVENPNRQCGRCHTPLVWRCGWVGKTAHPIVCYACVWNGNVPSGWMGKYLDAAEDAVRQVKDNESP